MAITIGLIAILNTLGYLAVIWAFRFSFKVRYTGTWWFATGFMILAGAIIARAWYWDIIIPMLRAYEPEIALWLTENIGTYMNIVFNVMKSTSFYCALKCYQSMIPDHERHEWPVWKVWMYPMSISQLLFRRAQ